MKALKLGLIVLGALGVAGLFLPYIEGLKLWDARHEDALKVYLPLAGYGLAALMGVWAMRSSLTRGKALIALVGFALAILVKEVRVGLKGEGFETAIGGKILFLTAVIGLVVALIGLIKPERA